MTLFASVYNRFLNTITDDMYLEMTPEDTIKDLQNLITNAIPQFEFPRVNLYDYEVVIKEVNEDEALPDDFIIGTVWGELPEPGEENVPKIIVDRSYFGVDLTEEEIYIIALIMKQGWVQRQVTSIENTRQKYTGSKKVASLLSNE